MQSQWVRVRFSRIDSNSDCENSEDATGLSRWRFTMAATKICKATCEMPRACPVDIHVSAPLAARLIGD